MQLNFASIIKPDLENHRLTSGKQIPIYTNHWYRHGVAVLNRNTSVSLGSHFAEFIDRQVQQGRYGSASDVVRAGLRLLEEQEAKVKMLQNALIEGELSGPPTQFDNSAFVKRMLSKHGG